MGADGIPRSDSKCERITLGASTWMCTSVKSHKLQVSEGTFIVHQSHLDKAEFTEGLPLAAGFRTDPRGQDGGRGLAKPLQGSRRERGWPAEGAQEHRESGCVWKAEPAGFADGVHVKCEGGRCPGAPFDGPPVLLPPKAPHHAGVARGQWVGQSD